jgi:hypothetical protein
MKFWPKGSNSACLIPKIKIMHQRCRSGSPVPRAWVPQGLQTPPGEPKVARNWVMMRFAAAMTSISVRSAES